MLRHHFTTQRARGPVSRAGECVRARGSEQPGLGSLPKTVVDSRRHAAQRWFVLPAATVPMLPELPAGTVDPTERSARRRHPGLAKVR